MMHVVILDEADLEHYEPPVGYRWACTSNTGLSKGKYRVTFLPESAFLKPGEEQKPSPKPCRIEDWLDEVWPKDKRLDARANSEPLMDEE